MSFPRLKPKISNWPSKLPEENSQGHPACLKNTTTLGRPSLPGTRNVVFPGAFVPITGGAATSIGAGAGVAHDCQLLGTERFAKGLAIGDNAAFPTPPSLELDLVSGIEKAFDGMPALRMAILVVSLANIMARIKKRLELVR